MNSINRFNPVAVATSVNIHGVRMQACDDGSWVSYAMHKQEIESLQARLKALESTQKHKISAPSIIADHVEQAIKEAVGKLVHEACEQLLKDLHKYNGDPCHNTVDAFVSELAASPGKTVVDDGEKFDYLTKDAKFTFGTNFGEGKALTMSVGGRESEHDRKVVVCVSGDGHNFITGAEYFYEFDSCEACEEPEVIYICSDAFVSDLQGWCRWTAKKISGESDCETYEVRHLNMHTSRITFQIK